MNEGLKALIANSIITTAGIANELFIVSNGTMLLAETDYVTLVANFQQAMAKKIMPIKTTLEFKEEIKKFVAELYPSLLQQFNDKESSNATESDQSSGNSSAEG